MTPLVAGFPGGFTILMAVYGKDNVKLLEKAIWSVFDNTLLPTAFVLVVDGPVVPSLGAAIAKLEADYPLHVLHLSKHMGLAMALNVGLREVKTEWVVRADADDLNLSHRFERLAEVVTGNSALDLVGSAILEVDSNGERVAVRRTPSNHKDIVRYVRHRNPFNHMTVAYRCRLALKCGGYSKIHLKEDYALWASMLNEGAVTQNIDEILVHATAGNDMYRRRGGWRYAVAEIELQRHLVNCKLKGRLFAIYHGITRSAVFLLPSTVRGYVYRKFLREQHSDGNSNEIF